MSDTHGLSYQRIPDDILEALGVTARMSIVDLRLSWYNNSSCSTVINISAKLRGSHHEITYATVYGMKS